MDELSERQINILKAVIEEYIETAEPVGSETLDKKYSLGVSPATIRNEMSYLTKKGFLRQPHTSAGRNPTSAALKYYVDNLMKQRDLSVADEVNVKQKVWEYRSETDRFLREATKALANHTGTMSLAATDRGYLYASGLGNILDMPEFFDIDMTKHLLETLDQYDFWWNLFSESEESALAVFLGEDLKDKYLSECGGVFVHFTSPSYKGAIGVVGPSRLDYPRIIPMVRYVGSLISEISGSW